MLSLARSRYTHFVRLGFISANTVGVFFGFLYKNTTPDLYPGSAHSAVGWIATGMAAAQISHLLVEPLTKLFNRIAGRDEIKSGRYTLPPMQEVHSLQDYDTPSAISRQGSFDVEATDGFVDDRDTSSNSGLYREDRNESDDTVVEDSGSIRVLHDDARAAISKMFSKPSLTRAGRIILLMYKLIDNTILIMGFVAFCTGIITFWGIFVSSDTPHSSMGKELTARSKGIPCSMASLIGSKVVYSFGSVF